MEDTRAWRRLANAAAAVALLTSPASFLFLRHEGHSAATSAALALVLVLAFRGVLEMALRTVARPPSIFDAGEEERGRDASARRRAWFWRKKVRLLAWLGGAVTAKWLADGRSHPWTYELHHILGMLATLAHPAMILQVVMLFGLFIANFALFFGPMMAMGISQMKAFEPGDADWGVKLDDVRGQAEAKEEIRKVVTLWQSGERFEGKGGKRERGLLLLGAPGTGKTMISKAIATNFNAPFLSMPGSGFAQTFIGMDVVIVRVMAARAKRLARKWGGQCIVFIDEIDAVGMRRASLGGAPLQKQIPGGMFGGMGGQMGLNQLLVVMDGIGEPPAGKRFFTARLNTWADAFFLPQRLRLPRPKPRPEQIFFVGATNVPLQNLDPALTRAGRMGRHIHFRQPVLEDRKDIFDLYLAKVAHDESVDIDELARITNGYSPASIEQICSLALTNAHHDGRDEFSRQDILEAMTTVEAGTAVGWDYTPEEKWRIAVHEAGHACAAHVFMQSREGTRLSVRRRGDSGGHHQAADKEDRFSHTRSEMFAEILWGLGSYAAELVFFGENTNGVGGDLRSATVQAGSMAGAYGMRTPIELAPALEDKAAAIGETLMNRMHYPADPFEKVFEDPGKRRQAAVLLGSALALNYTLMSRCKDGVMHVAERLVEEDEVFGNDLLDLLDEAGLFDPREKKGALLWPSL